MENNSENNIEKKLKEMVKSEKEFLESVNASKNEQGVYLYLSKDNNNRILLDYFLLEYKEWLIEKKIVKEI